MHILTWLFALPVALITAHKVERDELDAIQVDPGRHKVVLENDQVRVIRWTLPSGDKTLKHSHPDSLNINLTDYHGQVTTPNATSEVHNKAGSLGWRPTLFHEVKNIGKQAMEGVIVEPKKPASARPDGSADPAAADPEHQKVEFENEQIRVIREHYQAGEKVVPHGHPDSVQVLLTDMEAQLATDRKTEVITGRAGEVRWRGVTQHSGQVLAKPLEQIVIEMKGSATTLRRM